MSLISIKDLSFYYEGSHDMVFDHVSVQFDTDWKLGLTGRNGRGKTTLCRLLLGELEYQGKIFSSVNFDYFPFPVRDMDRKAGSIVAEVCPEAQSWEIDREISLLGLEEELLTRPFSTLSNGERTKLLLAALFLKENEFLLIDEPTNHLDMAGRRQVSRYLRGKRGFLLISHDRDFLDGCVDHILSINRSSIEVQRGNFSSWLYNREAQDKFELGQNEKLRREIKRLEKAAREKAEWSDKAEKTKYASKNSGLRPDRGYIGHKSAKMMDRAKAIENRRLAAVEEKSELLRDVERPLALKLAPIMFRTAALLSGSELSLSYGERQIFCDLSFKVDRGERVAVQGANGSGKSSLLKLICGEDIAYTGSLQRPGDLIISRVVQDAGGLSGTLRDFAAEKGIDESLLKAILRYLELPQELFEKDMAGFSDGHKKKTLLAGSLCRPAHLYVWDEPLNYIDLISRMQIERLLLDYKPTMIFVEHDEAFCRKIATRIIKI